MITYREATLVDLQAICVLGQQINALHHAAFPDVFAPSGDPQRDEGLWREMIGAPEATTFVAETAEGFGPSTSGPFGCTRSLATRSYPTQWEIASSQQGPIGHNPP